MFRGTSDYEKAIFEHIDDNSCLTICPRHVAVKAYSKTAGVPVKVFNFSAQPFTIKPKSQLCSLQEVNVIKTME